LATRGFDHDLAWRHEHQAERLRESSLVTPGNTGGGIKADTSAGARTALMDQAWRFTAVARPPGSAPILLLAVRSLPGSFIVTQSGARFINESTDYMSFGQHLLAAERAGQPIEKMLIVFDQEYRDSYVFAAGLFPRMPIPREWY